MISYIFGFFLLLIAFLVQITLGSFLSIKGVQPDFILIVVALSAFIEGPINGAVSGFFGGLMLDLVSIRNLGLGALCKTLVGYFAGLVERTILAENIILPMFAIFLATLVDRLIFTGVSFLLGSAYPFREVFWSQVIPTAIYNSLLVPLIYSGLLKLELFKKEHLSIR